MPSPILARADALMHRKRQNESEFDDLPVLTDAIDDEDDIPLLVDAETVSLAAEPAETNEAPPPAATAEPEVMAEPDEVPTPLAPPVLPPAALDNIQREHLARELARRVEQRLAIELPRIIEATVRDFLAEQEMISGLPPHD